MVSIRLQRYEDFLECANNGTKLFKINKIIFSPRNAQSPQKQIVRSEAKIRKGCLFLKKVDTLTLKCVTLASLTVCNVNTLTQKCVTFVTFVTLCKRYCTVCNALQTLLHCL